MNVMVLILFKTEYVVLYNHQVKRATIQSPEGGGLDVFLNKYFRSHQA